MVGSATWISFVKRNNTSYITGLKLFYGWFSSAEITIIDNTVNKTK